MSTTTTTTTTTLAQETVPTASTDQQYYGTLRFVPKGKTPEASPHNFHLPALSEFGDVRLHPLIDMRPVPTATTLPESKHAPQLATHGFAAIHHPTTMNAAPFTRASWNDPALLRQHYIPDTEAMVRQVTGATTVITEALLLRSAVWSETDALATHAGHGQPDTTTAASDQEAADAAADAAAAAEAKKYSALELGFPQFIGFNPVDGGASPAPKVHLDYSPDGARTHLRRYHPTLTAGAQGIIAAEDALRAAGKSLPTTYASHPNAPRWALYSIWRPLKRVRRDPLALGDARTFAEHDYIPTVVKFPNLGIPETSTHDNGCFVAHWSDGQKWYFVSHQEPEEVLVISLFDSSREGETVAAGGTLHSSVELPGTENEEARESLELRCLAIW